MSKVKADWKIYRTRFLIRARQLTEPLLFVDAFGHEHCGHTGDYVVETSDGVRRIAPRALFEDVYVPMGPADENWPAISRRELPMASSSLRLVPRDGRLS